MRGLRGGWRGSLGLRPRGRPFNPLTDYDWYVDSNIASSGDGTTLATAFKTGAEAKAVMQEGDTIYFAENSVILEEFRNTANVNNITLLGGGSYTLNADDTIATDTRPRFEGADAVASGDWVQDVTYTNCYKVSRTALADQPNVYQAVWDADTARLKRAASLAALDSAVVPSFYVPQGSFATGVAYDIHINVQGNPTSNGKTYKVSERRYGISDAGATGWTVRNIVAQRYQASSGSIALGKNFTLTDCEANWGYTHCSVFQWGTATDCIFRGGETSTDVACNSDTSTNRFKMLRCRIYGDDNTAGSCFLLHGEKIGDVWLEECHFEGHNAGIGLTAATGQIVLYKCTTKDCNLVSISQTVVAGSGSADVFVVECNGRRASASTGQPLGLSSMRGDSRVFVYKTFLSSNVSFAAYMQSNNVAGEGPLVHIAASILQTEAGTILASVDTQNWDLELYHSVVYAGTRGVRCGKADNIYAGDYNVLLADLTGEFLINQTAAWKTLATHQADTGQDANSLRGAPAFTSDPTAEPDPDARSFVTDAGSPCKTVKAGIADFDGSNYTFPAWVPAEVLALIPEAA